MSLILFPCPVYKQIKWSDTLGFLWMQKEAKICWIWSFISYLAPLPFLCSRRRWGKASWICRAGLWLQLGWIYKVFLQGCCPHTTPSPGWGKDREQQGQRGPCPWEPAPHWAVESRASHAQVSSFPGSEVHGTPLEASTNEKTQVILYPLPVGSNHVRFGYLFPDVTTPAPLWSAHLTRSRTEDTPDFLLCNEPHELLKPRWRGEQNLSTADETETFTSQRGNSALSEKVALEKALFSQNSFCMWNFLNSILQMLHFSISPTLQFWFLFFFFLFNLFKKISLHTED